jgi:hypothetical protein
VKSKHLLQVFYGFRDASGEVFGSIIILDGVVEWESGSWKEFYKTDSSNRQEFENLVQLLETFSQAHLGAAIEVFMFTDNYVTKCAYFRDCSRSRVFVHIFRGTTARMPPHFHRFLSNIKQDNRNCGHHLWLKNTV